MNSVSIIFPHQLFEKNPCLRKDTKVLLVEEHLFFNQYKFHKQKLVFQRASMKFYEEFLRTHSFDVEYIEAQNPVSDIRKLIPKLRNEGISEIYYTDVVDAWLDKRLQKSAADNSFVKHANQSVRIIPKIMVQLNQILFTQPLMRRQQIGWISFSGNGFMILGNTKMQ